MAPATAGAVLLCLVLVRWATLPTKSLAQIGDEVFRMFEANRKSE
jgi:hypothetical protein